MLSPGNLWNELWRVAKPVVAWRQKRLFDDTKEAEKILHHFSSLPPAQVALLLLPAIFHASAYRLLEELADSADLPDVSDTCRQLVSKIGQIARHWPLDLHRYEVGNPKLPGRLFFSNPDSFVFISGTFAVATARRAALVAVQVAPSQTGRLSRRGQLCHETDERTERRSTSGRISHSGWCCPTSSSAALGRKWNDKSTLSVFLNLFLLLKNDGSPGSSSRQPVPSKKEFVLRTRARRPGPGSESSCQRMYCCVEKDSFRIAVAFTEDTTFF